MANKNCRNKQSEFDLFTFDLFDPLRFSHSNCGSPPVKTYANKQTLLVEKSWRTAGSNQHCPVIFRSS